MTPSVPERRLWNGALTRAGFRRAADVVSWFGAVQAQEFPFAKWALALRMVDGTTDDAVERAFEDGAILRTHVMRPTWHFVSAADIRALLTLTGPRVQRAIASYAPRLELDARTLNRSAEVITRALEGRSYRTRSELADALAAAGLPMRGQRLAHAVMYAELEALICSGPRRGTQFTYALLDERVPAVPPRSRDEALVTLAGRYFASHGPATIRDFVWWSGLTTVDARAALAGAGGVREEIDGLTYWSVGRPPRGRPREAAVHLLPIYDEYLIAYRDRQAVPHGAPKLVAGSGGPVTFQHAVIAGGQVAGTWRVRRERGAIAVTVTGLRRFTRVERQALEEAAARYGRFLSAPIVLTVQ